jgi:hypothetical protein
MECMFGNIVDARNANKSAEECMVTVRNLGTIIIR